MDAIPEVEQGRRRARWLVPLVGALVASAILATASPAAAQTDDCDPVYGCPTTTTAPSETQLECSLSVHEAGPGEVVTAHVTGAAEGTELQVTFEGSVVATGVAGPDGTADIDWRVPEVPEGTYQVFVVGAGLSASCSADPGFAVLGTRYVGGDGGGLPVTGANLAILVAVALVFVLAGRLFLAASRRR